MSGSTNSTWLSETINLREDDKAFLRLGNFIFDAMKHTAGRGVADPMSFENALRRISPRLQFSFVDAVRYRMSLLPTFPEGGEAALYSLTRECAKYCQGIVLVPPAATSNAVVAEDERNEQQRQPRVISVRNSRDAEQRSGYYSSRQGQDRAAGKMVVSPIDEGSWGENALDDQYNVPHSQSRTPSQRNPPGYHEPKRKTFVSFSASEDGDDMDVRDTGHPYSTRSNSRHGGRSTPMGAVRSNRGAPSPASYRQKQRGGRYPGSSMAGTPSDSFDHRSYYSMMDDQFSRGISSGAAQSNEVDDIISSFESRRHRHKQPYRHQEQHFGNDDDNSSTISDVSNHLEMKKIDITSRKCAMAYNEAQIIQYQSKVRQHLMDELRYANDVLKKTRDLELRSDYQRHIKELEDGLEKWTVGTFSSPIPLDIPRTMLEKESQAATPKTVPEEIGAECSDDDQPEMASKKTSKSATSKRCVKDKKASKTDESVSSKAAVKGSSEQYNIQIEPSFRSEIGSGSMNLTTPTAGYTAAHTMEQDESRINTMLSNLSRSTYSQGGVGTVSTASYYNTPRHTLQSQYDGMSQHSMGPPPPPYWQQQQQNQSLHPPHPGSQSFNPEVLSHASNIPHHSRPTSPESQMQQKHQHAQSSPQHPSTVSTATASNRGHPQSQSQDVEMPPELSPDETGSKVDGDRGKVVDAGDGGSKGSKGGDQGTMAAASPPKNPESQGLVKEGTREVKVQAPDILPEGYVFEANLGGDIFKVMVPKGGVQKHEIFTSPVYRVAVAEKTPSKSPSQQSKQEQMSTSPPTATINVVMGTSGSHASSARRHKNTQLIPTGRWRDSILNCFGDGFEHPMFLNSLFCPHVALTQIMARLNLNSLGDKTHPDILSNNPNYRPTPSVSGVLTIQVLFLCLHTILIYFCIREGVVAPLNELLAMLIPLAVLDLSIVIYFYTLVIKTRRALREACDIDPPACTGLMDLTAAVMCTSCVLSQMGRHTAEYKTYRAVCCSDTGLPNHIECTVPTGGDRRKGMVIGEGYTNLAEGHGEKILV